METPSRDRPLETLVVSVAHSDFCGLHELLGHVARRLPDVTPEERFAACRRVAVALCSRGHVALFRLPPRSSRPDRDGRIPVAPDAARGVLEDPDSWQVPQESAELYWLRTTEEGERAHFSEEVLSL